MSRKRSKNRRKKEVRRRKTAGELTREEPHREEATPEPEFLEPEVAPRDLPSGGGALGALRAAVIPRGTGSGDTLLTKRRSVPELLLWLAGAGGVVWGIWRVFGEG